MDDVMAMEKYNEILGKDMDRIVFETNHKRDEGKNDTLWEASGVRGWES